jgi:hypothetical protein
MKKVYVRLRGGIGNQLFQYAMARRLASYNNAELIIDNISGFLKDVDYRRSYELDIFNLPFKTLSSNTFFLYNYKRKIIKLINRFYKLKNNIYLEEVNMSFDKHLLDFQFNKCLYLDGYWQCYEYFSDVQKKIKSDLQLDLNQMYEDKELLMNIYKHESVAIHFRFFSNENSVNNSDNISFEYYKKAILYSTEKLCNPHFFIFSDNIKAIQCNEFISSLKNITYVNSSSQIGDMCDLWLMSLCKHNIIANSTFSWWAAWLNNNANKIIICPDIDLKGKTTTWGFEGLIPKEWIKIY